MIRLIALVAAAMLAFAANSVLARLALGSGAMGAAPYTAIRLVAGAVCLVVLVIVQRSDLDLGGALRSRRRWSAAIALFVYAIGFSLAYLRLGAGTGALILFATVQFGILGWALSQGERLGSIAIAGLVLALGALVYLLSPGLTAPDPLGAALMVAAGIAWAAYTLIGRGSLAPLRDTAQNFVLSLPLALVTLLASPAGTVTVAGALYAVASGAIASGIGYAIWYAALPQLTRLRAGIVQLSVPAIAAIGGVLLIGEQISWRLGLCAILILGGVAISIAAPALKRRDRPSPT